MTVTVESLAIPAVKLVRHSRHTDERGFLEELFAEDDFRDLGLPDCFRQDNRSFSTHRSTVRGLHFSVDPQGVAKLVTVVRGSIADVALDLRPDSSTFGRHVIHELSESEPSQMYIPADFAHGFITLDDDTEVIYKMTQPWKPELDRGVVWDDPDLGIGWPIRDDTTLSERDAALPAWKEVAAILESGHRRT